MNIDVLFANANKFAGYFTKNVFRAAFLGSILVFLFCLLAITASAIVPLTTVAIIGTILHYVMNVPWMYTVYAMGFTWLIVGIVKLK